jgi:hypothetical protein
MEQAKIFLEQAKIFLEKALALILEMVARGGEPLILAAAVVLFILGLLVLYKKGPSLGIPISLAGALLMVMAILSQLLSF